MLAKKYEANQLNSLLNSLFEQRGSGILSLKTQVNSWNIQRSFILVFHNGALVYGDSDISEIPSNLELCKALGDKLNPNLINAALSLAEEKVTNPKSIREFIETLVKMRVFTWEQIENLVTNKILVILEILQAYPGKAQWNPNITFDLTYGADKHSLNPTYIQQQLIQRQKIWQSYQPEIPAMDAIPRVSEQQLQKVNNAQVVEHFKNTVDGRRNLIDIAEKMDKDPIAIARNYFTWANNGWVSFGNTSTSQVAPSVSPTVVKNAPVTPPPTPKNTDLPVVLSVDDSPIIQVAIKRALQEDYKVLLADKATEALDILNKEPVKLLLLDLTMPDVDGLEFCQQIRQMPKFRYLPIIMVTARDGLMNKMKGHVAGTTRYITKPFKPEELREVVAQYIN
ncbi:hypothetical protein NIES4102_26580 [Chondrocystis sp. NIES-4102]|nr:hypothetical protein NIES4102_26580 [Chondrocystis sp. NIES-4102]